MTVEVMMNHEKTTYGFDPQHKAEVIGFYTKEYWSGRIQGFRATLADGQIVAIGAC
jgi:hypothetical protein